MTTFTNAAKLLGFITALLLTLVLTQTAEAAATPKPPSVSAAKKVVKGMAPQGAVIAALPSTDNPSVRMYVVDFNPQAYVAGEANPQTGLVVAVAKAYAIVSFYGNGTLLYSSGGPLADKTRESWSLVAPDGAAINPDDLRIQAFLDAVDALPNDITLPDSNGDAQTASISFAAAVKLYKMAKYCSALPFARRFCATKLNGLAMFMLTKALRSEMKAKTVFQSCSLASLRKNWRYIYGASAPRWVTTSFGYYLKVAKPCS